MGFIYQAHTKDLNFIGAQFIAPD